MINADTPLPDFEAELHNLWSRCAAWGPGGMERSIMVTTWFNDHVGFRLCDTPQQVQLFDNQFEWRALMMREWSEILDAKHAVHFFLVHPHPVADYSDSVAHVVLLQRPHAD